MKSAGALKPPAEIEVIQMMGADRLVHSASTVDGCAAARRSTLRGDPAAIKEAARQFEAMFMQEVMKSMRQATLASGMLDNAGSQLGTEMLDTSSRPSSPGCPAGCPT